MHELYTHRQTAHKHDNTVVTVSASYSYSILTVFRASILIVSRESILANNSIPTVSRASILTIKVWFVNSSRFVLMGSVPATLYEEVR